ncbi:flagellar basal body-associated FliL family protein [Marivivens donghaensis]|uniref:Flagellar basal body-associated FliL family protein n=1 Tax=Marivivens donghaensis TaxID=1699413 RepID=A0ABX0W1K9_9RHOB|nr:flagellar basal body-associated FliL family protein [Marivivens donghaensis]NIY73307.1 flagellar basal body-associated FliL family protein [Marivivens donghaensis]
MRLLIPVLFFIIGIAAGTCAGYFLSSDEAPHEAAEEHAPDEEHETTAAYAKLNNQFIVPVVEDAEMRSVVVLSLSLQVPEDEKDSVYAMEPKLRDVLFSALMEHANLGGFSGNFTSSDKMRTLRQVLKEAAEVVLPDAIEDVLILDIARQDV